ncbi:hypothetical protein [Parasphingopyxis marina]|uniref:Uncharacterized protein n=1 Tax=Parasphingopyxis marina TaxID=2761622 RepID=A0A842HY82_9SPHN|nr:hypothetical protein [Parasphingopyxis marina]MBC2777407.1 hypothetical protein [Parasphingopyxis marina]
MKKIIAFAAICAIPAALSAAPYPVAEPTGYDPYAADAIARADYSVAEERLVRRLDANGSDISALLNLAAVMTETDRVARASSLLEQVLDADNVMLEGANGQAVWSHDAATAALRSRVTVGAR